MQNNTQNNEWKDPYAQDRVRSGVPGELSRGLFNLAVGGTIVWGFALCFLMLNFLPVSSIARTLWGGKSLLWLLLVWLGYLVLAGIGSHLMESGNTLKCFLGFNLIAVPLGFLAAVTLNRFDPELVRRAVLLTGIITTLVMVAATFFPAVFDSWGRALGLMLGTTLIIEIACALLFPGAIRWLDYVVVFIMCGYIGYDWARIEKAERTLPNAIGLAAHLYLDILNILLRVVRILARNRDSK